jgi:hypothetical protein
VSLVPYNGEPGRAWVELLPVAVELAKAVADTEFVPKALRHNPPAIAACILYGDEIGMGPMQSLAKIAMVDGKPTLFAEAQRGLVLARGHEMWIEENSNTRVTWAGRRTGTDMVIRATWTMDDAKQAGLAGKHNWKSYPRQMLSARASADLVRLLFADVTGGLAAADEVDAGERPPSEPGTAVIPVDAAPSARRRRRSPSSTLGVGPSSARPAPSVVDGEAGPPLPWEEPEPQPEPITPAQQTKMQTLFRESGLERADRLAYSTAVIGRTIASSRQLTKDEASSIIDRLEQQAQTPPEAPQTPPKPPEEET